MGSGHGSGSGLFRAGSPSGLTLPMPCTGQGLAPDPQPPGHLGPAQPASRGAAHPEPILHPQLTVCRAGLQGARATLLLPRPTGARRPQSREPATSRARGQASNRGPGGKCSLRSVGWGLRRPPPQRLQAPAAGRRPQARVPKGQQPSCGGTCLPEGGGAPDRACPDTTSPVGLSRLRGKLGPTGWGRPWEVRQSWGMRCLARTLRTPEPPRRPQRTPRTRYCLLGQVRTPGYEGGGGTGRQSWGTTGLDPGSPRGSSCSPRAPCTLAALHGAGMQECDMPGLGQGFGASLSCAGPRQMEPG